jgi:hypothetical protein
VDLGEGATVTVSDAGERYLSIMVVSQDHYITDVLHDAGQYELNVNVVVSRYALIAARVLVDPEDPRRSRRRREAPGRVRSSGTVGGALRDAALREDQLRWCVLGAEGPGSLLDEL